MKGPYVHGGAMPVISLGFRIILINTGVLWWRGGLCKVACTGLLGPCSAAPKPPLSLGGSPLQQEQTHPPLAAPTQTPSPAGSSQHLAQQPLHSTMILDQILWAFTGNHVDVFYILWGLKRWVWVGFSFFSPDTSCHSLFVSHWHGLLHCAFRNLQTTGRYPFLCFPQALKLQGNHLNFRTNSSLTHHSEGSIGKGLQCLNPASCPSFWLPNLEWSSCCLSSLGGGGRLAPIFCELSPSFDSLHSVLVLYCLERSICASLVYWASGGGLGRKLSSQMGADQLMGSSVDWEYVQWRFPFSCRFSEITRTIGKVSLNILYTEIKHFAMIRPCILTVPYLDLRSLHLFLSNLSSKRRRELTLTYSRLGWGISLAKCLLTHSGPVS